MTKTDLNQRLVSVIRRAEHLANPKPDYAGARAVIREEIAYIDGMRGGALEGLPLDAYVDQLGRMDAHFWSLQMRDEPQGARMEPVE